MTQESYKHPIAPPPELLTRWENDWFNERENVDVLLIQAFQAGADQELEECCEEMKSLPSPLGIPFGEMASNALRSARRPEPKPYSLKEQALAELAEWENVMDIAPDSPIRRALEQLPE